jgi:hypothetical protein
VLKTLRKALNFWSFFVGPALSVALVAVVCTFRPPQIDLLHWFVMATGAALAVEVYFLPHYAAPLTAPLYGVLLQGMRRLRLICLKNGQTGRCLLQLIFVLCTAMWIVRAAGSTVRPPQSDWALTRSFLAISLKRTPESHLIIVQYDRGHSPHQEWVYNDANIDNARIVWARDMGEFQNRELVQYFAGRCIWLLNPDRAPNALIPYSRRTRTQQCMTAAAGLMHAQQR